MRLDLPATGGFNLHVMSRRIRLLAVALLAFVLPMQGAAAACAQICAKAAEQRDAAAQAEMHLHEDAPADHGDLDGNHCAKSEIGAGKCCQSHSATPTSAAPLIGAPAAAFERTSFVARWTNFIPEDPSPPPIHSAA